MLIFEDMLRHVEESRPSVTVLVEPHRLEEIRAAVEAAGFWPRVTVLASASVPAGQLLVFDGVRP